EVQERGFHILEPVWHTGRDDNHVTLVELMCVAAIDATAANFVRASALAFEHFATGHECSGAVDYIEHVGVLFMKLGLSGLVTMSGHDGVISIFAIKERAALFKARTHV